MVIRNQFDLCKKAKRKKMKSDYQRLKFKSLCFHHHICYLLINKVYYIPNLSLIRTSTRWLSLNVSIFVLIFPLENTLNLENINVTILLLISTFIHLSHE